MTHVFHGLWASRYIGFVNAFNVNTLVHCEDVDAYIAIDTKTFAPLVAIYSFRGTKLHLHPFAKLQKSDVFYCLLEPNILGSVHLQQHGPYETVGDVFHPCLQYIANGQSQPGSILVTCDFGVAPCFPTRHCAFILTTGGPLWLDQLSKTLDPPLPQPLVQARVFQQYANDTYGILPLFEYLFHRLYSFIATNPSENADIVPSYTQAKDLYKQYISPHGQVFETPLDHLWTSKHNSGLTEVFTQVFPFATPGSQVILQNLPKRWSELNNQPMRASIFHYTDDPHRSPSHLDIPTRVSKIVVHKDTNGFPDYEPYSEPRLILDTISSTTRNTVAFAPTIRVRHRVHPSMEYADFIAAVLAFQYDLFGVSQHTGYSAWVYTENQAIPETWLDLQHALRSNTVMPVPFRWRSNRVYIYAWYHNPVMHLKARKKFTIHDPTLPPFCHFNDPLIPMHELIINGQFDYHIVQENYLLGPPICIYWRLAGPCIHPFQAALTHQGYKQSGSKFESMASSEPALNLLQGSQGWTLLGDQGAVCLDPSLDSSKCAEIRHQLYGQRIYNPHTHQATAYLRIAGFDLSDSLLLMHDIRMNTDQIMSSPRKGSENFCGVVAPLMKMLLDPQTNYGHAMSTMIVDLRGNAGGLALMPFLASFFGGDRQGLDGAKAIPNPSYLQAAPNQNNKNRICNSWTDLLASRHRQSYRGILEASDEIVKQVYVTETMRRYGAECVFKNGTLVILTDEAACSEGDEAPHWFLGDAYDRNIGNNVRVYLVGEGDMRIKGGTFTGFNKEGLPLYSNALKDSHGQPVCPIPISRIENGGAGADSMKGSPLSIQDERTALDVLLPGNIETVWRDVGLVHGDRTGVRFGSRRSWRDSWLDEALRVAALGL